MKLVSRFEAATMSTPVLRGLLGQAKRAFAHAACGSQQRLDVLESIRNIEHVLTSRAPRL
ncbi:MAG: hypothetical protein Tsb0016_11060 [Sphingomonadales bacterium]